MLGGASSSLILALVTRTKSWSQVWVIGAPEDQDRGTTRPRWLQTSSPEARFISEETGSDLFEAKEVELKLC